MADTMSIDKTDPIKEDSEDSMGSSPEGEEAPPTNRNNNPQETQPPKRKGGRKPVRASFLVHLAKYWDITRYKFLPNKYLLQFRGHHVPDL